MKLYNILFLFTYLFLNSLTFSMDKPFVLHFNNFDDKLPNLVKVASIDISLMRTFEDTRKAVENQVRVELKKLGKNAKFKIDIKLAAYIEDSISQEFQDSDLICKNENPDLRFCFGNCSSKLVKLYFK